MTKRRLIPAQRRLRAQLSGDWLFDTLQGRLLFEEARHPTWAVPARLLGGDRLFPTAGPNGLDGEFFSLRATGGPDVRTWPVPPEDLPELSQLVTIEIAAVDAWFEEDSRVFFRPRDPYRRVDVLESSRHLRVVVDGVTLIDSRRPRVALETRLPPQWYGPRSDVDWSLMTASSRATLCQYKGRAQYWDLTTRAGKHEALAWSYEFPVPEVCGLASLVALPSFDRRVTTFVDGVAQPCHPPDLTWMNPSINPE